MSTFPLRMSVLESTDSLSSSQIVSSSIRTSRNLANCTLATLNLQIENIYPVSIVRIAVQQKICSGLKTVVLSGTVESENLWDFYLSFSLVITVWLNWAGKSKTILIQEVSISLGLSKSPFVSSFSSVDYKIQTQQVKAVAGVLVKSAVLRSSDDSRSLCAVSLPRRGGDSSFHLINQKWNMNSRNLI